MSQPKLGPICYGAPEEPRTEREMRVYAALQRLQIPFVRLDHEAVYSAADGSCDAIDAALDIPNLKNLFLRNADQSRYFMVTLPADKRADLKKLAQQLGVSRLSFGKPEQMEAFLDLQPGADERSGWARSAGFGSRNSAVRGAWVPSMRQYLQPAHFHEGFS